MSVSSSQAVATITKYLSQYQDDNKKVDDKILLQRSFAVRNKFVLS